MRHNLNFRALWRIIVFAIGLWSLDFLTQTCHATSNTITLTVRVTDYNLANTAVRSVRLIPMSPGGDYQGAFIGRTEISPMVYTNGTAIFTNVVTGYAYRLGLTTLFGTTYRTNYFESSLTGSVDAYSRESWLIGFSEAGRVLQWVWLNDTNAVSLMTNFATKAFVLSASNSITANLTNFVAGTSNSITANTTNLVLGASNSITANLTNFVRGTSNSITANMTNYVSGIAATLQAEIDAIDTSGGTNGGSATNVFFLDSSTIDWSKTGGSNVAKLNVQVTNQWLADIRSASNSITAATTNYVTGSIATASNTSLTVSTNVNNSLFGFDSDALIYCQQRGISNLSDMFKIDGFVRTRKAGGIWSLVVDTWLLRSNLNSINLTNAISWNGKQHTVYGATAPLYDETGLTFTYNASGALWITNMADMRTNTVVVQAQIDAATWDQTNPLLVLQNGSRFQSFTNSYLGFGVIQNGNSGIQWRQGISNNYNFATWEDHHRLNGFGLAGSFPSDYPRIYATTISNTTWQGWFENIPAGPFTLTPVLSTAATPMTSAATGGPLTNMIIGARADGSGGFASFGGKVQYISIYSRPLTQQQIECENRAFRCLDAQTENWIFFGDSRFAGYSFDAAGAVGDQRNGFVNQLMNQLGNSDVRFYNMSVPAIDMSQQNAASNFVRSISFYAPDGRYVKKTRAFILASGVNSFSDGDTVLAAFNLASNLCAQTHKAGIEVNLFTEASIATGPYSTNSTGASWTNFATSYNNMLVTNTGMYDRLFRFDLAFENYDRTTNSGFYTDHVHPSAAGNRKWAAFTRKEIMGVGDVIDSLKLQQNGSNAVSLTFGGSTINGGRITNGVFYGDGSQLTGISGSGTGIATNGGSGTGNTFSNATLLTTTATTNYLTINGTGAARSAFVIDGNLSQRFRMMEAYYDANTALFGVVFPNGLTSESTIVGDSFSGDGSSLTALNASTLATGYVPRPVTNSAVKTGDLVVTNNATISGNINVAGTFNVNSTTATNFTIINPWDASKATNIVRLVYFASVANMSIGASGVKYMPIFPSGAASAGSTSEAATRMPINLEAPFTITNFSYFTEGAAAQLLATTNLTFRVFTNGVASPSLTVMRGANTANNIYTNDNTSSVSMLAGSFTNLFTIQVSNNTASALAGLYIGFQFNVVK